MICPFIIVFFLFHFIKHTDSKWYFWKPTKRNKNGSSLCNLKVSIYIYIYIYTNGVQHGRPYVQHFVKKKRKRSGQKWENKKYFKACFHCNLWYTMLVYMIGITRMVSCTYSVLDFKYLLYISIDYIDRWSVDLAESFFRFFPESNLKTHNYLLLRIDTSSIVYNSTLSEIKKKRITLIKAH